MTFLPECGADISSDIRLPTHQVMIPYMSDLVEGEIQRLGTSLDLTKGIRK